MKYSFLFLSLWPVCAISAQQVQTPSSKDQLVRELAKLGCRFYVGEPDGPISFNQNGLTDFRSLGAGNADMSTIRGIQIDKRVNERTPFPEILAKSVRQHFPDIELLLLDRNPSAIQAFSKELQHLTNLRYLHIYHGDSVAGSKDIVAAVAELEELEALRLWNGWLADGLAGSLGRHPKMRYLVLAPLIQRDDGKRNGEAVNSLSAPMLTFVVSKMPDLHYLETVRCRLEGNFQWTTFAKLRRLETIKFRWSEITDDQLEGISMLDRLKHLDLYYAPITEKALIELSALGNLKYLGIYDTNIRSGISHLEVQDDLQLGCDPRMFTEPLSEDELVLLLRFGVQGPYGNDKNNGEGQYSLLRMAKNKELNTVMIERATIEPQAFVTAKAWESLRLLQIEEVNFVAQDADRCRGIEAIPNLERLTLGGTSLTDDDVTHFARIQSLKGVEVHGSFTRSVIPRFAASPNLNSLGLIGLKLANMENDLIPLRNSQIKYLRLNHSTESREYGNIYSKSLAKRLGITMAGECSCGCMDIEPR